MWKKQDSRVVANGGLREKMATQPKAEDSSGATDNQQEATPATIGWRKLRRTEDRVRALQERLRKLVEVEKSPNSAEGTEHAVAILVQNSDLRTGGMEAQLKSSISQICVIHLKSSSACLNVELSFEVIH
ncbi:UNVERIFIED_CONTAM: hypothetical protein Scaly_0839700 [Sesamum calycinum]|uniref:Uncharacterized protein n=1 Tax=Sesamum calycinum TaxID=2727403 RepID=A0AAW2RBP5_9LAMI